VVGIKEFFNNREDVFGMDRNRAFLLHNLIVF
jgi:hypothetical protein